MQNRDLVLESKRERKSACVCVRACACMRVHVWVGEVQQGREKSLSFSVKGLSRVNSPRPSSCLGCVQWPFFFCYKVNPRSQA